MVEALPPLPPSLSLADAARGAPTSVGLVVDGAARTYAELADGAARIRGALAARGLGRRTGAGGGSVAFVGEPCEATLLLVYALLDAGVTLVPLHPRLTPYEREAILADARPDVVVASPSAELRDLADVAPAPASAPSAAPLVRMYTSGTEGKPKAALLGREAVLAALEASARALGWRDDDRWLLCMPLAHIGGLSIPFRCLAARRPCVLVTGRFDAGAVREAVRRDQVTLASLVPTMLDRLLAEAPSERDELPGGLRAVLLGGAAAPPSLVARARTAGLPVLCTYGLTETCAQVTLQRADEPDDLDSAGYPLPGVELRVEAGEIQVRTRSAMRGYESPGPNGQPFTDDGWLRTGDLGSLDAAGRLHVDARRKDLVVTGGENVYPAEVEAVLAELPGVAQVCVFGIPDARWGAVVAAALVLSDPTAAPPLEALRELVAARLASHKRPRAVAVLDELPTTPSGKVKRGEVATLAGPTLRSLDRPIHP